MKTIYLQRSLSLSGTSALGGRQLVDRLRETSEDFLLGHMIMPEALTVGTHPSIRKDVISEIQLLELNPDVVFIEDGLFSGNEGNWRMDKRLATEFVEKGGVLIIADVDLNTLRQERSAYEEASIFLGAKAAYQGSEPIGGYDQVSFWEGEKQILCKIEDMVVSEWLKPIYEGIPEILCGLPVRLSAWGDILAAGNMHSTQSDSYLGMFPELDNLPFASVQKRGDGFVVLICSAVTHDAWLEGCPHNTQWLVNVAKFLTESAAKDRQRSGSALKSREALFLSHAHKNKEVVTEVYQQLTREHNIGTWLDQQKLIEGDSLPKEIEAGIRSATYFVLFWSEAAAQSEWVQRELEMALTQPDATLLVIRLDETSVPAQLTDILRIEASDEHAAEIARQISRIIERRQRRGRVQEARQEAEKAEKAMTQAQANKFAPPRPAGTSLTRAEDAPLPESPKSIRVVGTLPTPVKLASIRSKYRIDILSFLDSQTLIAGSGDFDAEGPQRAQVQGLIGGFQKVRCGTGMDGHWDDHLPSRRHLIFDYDEMKIFDRTAGDVMAVVKINEGCMSAKWNPAGDRIVVGSMNFLTIATDDGRRIFRENLWNPDENYAPKSVVWQPSINPIYVSEKSVWVADPDGRIIQELKALDSAVIAAAVSPDCRFIAGAAMNGQVAIWSETGELLTTFDGFLSDAWHSAHCLAFSPDSRFLAQSACIDSDGFMLLDLMTGKSVQLREAKTTLLAFHPQQPDILLTAASDQITFWQLS